MKVESPRFYEEVTDKLGGETVTKCFQCGTCASSCPVAKITSRFNPRILIKNVLLGSRKHIVVNEPIWLCCSCYNCQERCPQEVEIAEVIYALRNIALKEGRAPKSFIEISSNFISEGRVVPVSAFALKRRESLGLPPLKTTGVKALSKILNTTSFTKSIKKIKEVSK